MSHAPRYAIYYTPAADHPLCKLGSEWLGRDAFTGETVARREFPGIKDADIERLTSSPSHYGFHATMKAPFALQSSKTEDQLVQQLRKFSRAQTPFQVRMAVRPLGPFLALRLTENIEAMRELHTACVLDFDGFRAPLTDEDIERRRKANLSPEQDARMLKWGYPYIFEEFRWHMTLSNRIVSDNTRRKTQQVLEALFEDVLSAPLTIDGIAVYRQVDRCAPFNIVERAKFPALADQPV